MLAACGQDNSNNAVVDSTAESISKEMNYTITGLEPGAGQTEINDQAIETYDNLDGWEQQTSSTGAMLSVLDEAIQNEEPIMITAWSPHFMHARWDIKYVDDPEGVFGDEIHAGTLTRLGLKEDMPIAHDLLERLNWDIEVVEDALLQKEEENLEMDVVAQQWVDEHPKIIEEWQEGLEKVDGTPFNLGSTIWDDALFTAHAAKIILEMQGFDVELSPVDPAILFEALATNDIDATLSPWLPTTHGALYDEHEGKFEDIAKNVEGGRLGLAIPSYMEIDSLDEFTPKK